MDADGFCTACCVLPAQRKLVVRLYVLQAVNRDVVWPTWQQLSLCSLCIKRLSCSALWKTVMPSYRQKNVTKVKNSLNNLLPGSALSVFAMSSSDITTAV